MVLVERGIVYMLLEEVKNLGNEYVYCIVHIAIPHILYSRINRVTYYEISNLHLYTRKILAWIDLIGGIDKLKFYNSNFTKVVDSVYQKSKYKNIFDFRSRDYHGSVPGVIVANKQRRLYRHVPIQFISRNRMSLVKLNNLAINMNNCDIEDFDPYRFNSKRRCKLLLI